jgi:hypothetical protein
MLMDGCFAATGIVENRRDDVLKFMRATYRAMDAMTDKNIRKTFSVKWFTDNGRTYDDKTMEDEMKLREYITKPVMERYGDSYVFGAGMNAIGAFFMSDGKISKENFPNIVKSFDPSFTEEILGMKLKVQK